MDAALRQALEACLTDALARASWTATTAEHTSLEGSYLVVTEEGASTPTILTVAVPPTQSPFDEIVRDRARSVAARIQAPWILVTSFRTAVLYAVEKVTRRLPPEEMIAAQATGADVLSTDEIMVSSHRVAETDAIRRCLLAIKEQPNTATSTKRRAPFLITRVTALLEEMLACTDRSDHQIGAVERLGTSILGYALLALRHPEDLQTMQIPYGARSSALILDLVGAYLREANRQGHRLFPEALTDIVVAPNRDRLFTSIVSDLVNLVEDMHLERFRPEEIHHMVDAILLWCARIRATPVPTVDAIDLAVIATHLGDLPHQSEPRILEIGSTIGMFGVRARLILPRAETRVFAATDLEERQLLLRASGQLEERDDVRILRSLTDQDEPWDALCIALTHDTDPYQLQTTLTTVRLADEGSVVLFVPLRVLREKAFAEFRQFLTANFDVRWVFTADAEPLAEPDNGTCCVILQPLQEGASPEATNFGFIRTAMSSLIPPTTSLRTFSLDRVERLRVFLRYLVSSERGKINQEVVVRRVARSSLLLRTMEADAGWDDFIVPPDVIASILSKLADRLRPLQNVGEVFSGLRTGANEVLAPDLGEIADHSIEDTFWQRTLEDGHHIDNTVITAADEITSISGIPSSDRRLLLLPTSRSAIEGTNVATHLDRAEREGVHTRPSVRGREPWWHLEPPIAPDLIIPKQQRDRWIVATNPARAFITDACIGVHLHDPGTAEALALWMNSSLGQFLSELVQVADHVADVTVRDAKEFLVPTAEVLAQIDVKTFKDMMFRPQESLAAEYGTGDPDVIRPHLVRRDRRRLDRTLMADVFGMSDEEQRWIYRFALAWRGSSTNIRHLANALATQISMQDRLQPMWQWYSPRIEQLPDGASRILVLAQAITHAEHERSMFNHQVTLYRGTKKDDVIDCTSAEEAELITTLVNLGKRTVELPTDAPLLAEVMPLVRSFSDRLYAAVDEAVTMIPADIREPVREHILTTMVS